MSLPMDHCLLWIDRELLRIMGWVVPPAERPEWSRTWYAELWHMRNHRATRGAPISADLSTGLIRDALWLRMESWRRTFVGTATLCIASLAALSMLSMAIGIAIAGSRHAFDIDLKDHLLRSIVAAALVLFVAFATSSRKHTAKNSHIKLIDRLSRQLFFAWKIAQVVLLAFVLSVELSIPVHRQLPNTADFFQLLDFVFLAILGLRWALRDQELRCKQCLQSLTTPSRVGRPSHNLLEWNGSEMNCRHGHGMLSVPEMETSWCEAARWIERSDAWHEPAAH